MLFRLRSFPDGQIQHYESPGQRDRRAGRDGWSRGAATRRSAGRGQGGRAGRAGRAVLRARHAPLGLSCVKLEEQQGRLNRFENGRKQREHEMDRSLHGRFHVSEHCFISSSGSGHRCQQTSGKMHHVCVMEPSHYCGDDESVQSESGHVCLSLCCSLKI